MIKHLEWSNRCNALGRAGFESRGRQCTSDAPRRVVPASGGTGESEAFDEFLKKSMRRRVGGGIGG
jgi:hypothetical protein